MFKIANQVLDAYDDVDHKILRKVAKLDPKIYLMSNDERQKLSDNDFALSVITKKASKLNKFPVDTYDNAWLSNQYFNETHLRLPKEAAEIAAYHIKKACEQHEIETTPAVEGMAKEAYSNVYYEGDLTSNDKTQKVVDVDLSKFAEVEKISDSYTFAQYAFPTQAHVKLANMYFDKYAEAMPLEVRHGYASNLQKRAGELGINLKGKISKYAANAYGAHVNAHLSSRKSLLEVADPKYAAALEKLGHMKDSLSPSEFAKLLHGFDKRAGLDKYYGGYLLNPYEATFANQHNPSYEYKSASYNSLSADMIGKISSEKYAKIKEYFGSSVADALKKEGAPVFESLPNDAKEIIAGIADGSL
ncbi:MAG: hypothetical protein EBZ49_00135 [Proteobacteria bacterium]|nr:hypothetical protein [Pseudomonadota bacterium]